MEQAYKQEDVGVQNILFVCLKKFLVADNFVAVDWASHFCCKNNNRTNRIDIKNSYKPNKH